MQPIRNSWNQKGVTIVSDGRSDPQRRPLINFMVVTESEPMFLKAVNCSGDIKDKDFIAQHMKDAIMKVGSSNVVQIVTDAVLCKTIGMIIENEFPTIYWTPYVVHTSNLALKNICAAKDSEKNNVLGSHTQIVDNANLIKKFTMGHFEIINVKQFQLIIVIFCYSYKICINYCDVQEVQKFKKKDFKT